MSQKDKVIVQSVFICPGCMGVYDTRQRAEECLKDYLERPGPTLKVGDIVTTGYYPYGWNDGDERWVESEGSGLHNRTSRRFYYVVTDIRQRLERGWHDWLYTVVTRAMSPDSGYRGGWTTDTTHVRMVLIENPPDFIVEDAKTVMDERPRGLL